jgi:predicted signal transduction protein with EAL and GGDEF domain
VSVNMPPELLAAPESVQFVVDALEGARVDPSRLCLELLETRDLELASTDKAVGELTELGVKVHLDDIGSGYSTLQRVADLPFEVIKVDRHIFDSVRTRPLQVITVLSAIIKLGADFDYGVTVEGVETQERLEVSTALGARFGQGYLFARPMPAADVLEWARQFAPPTPFGTVTTPLGALAYQWVCTRTPEVQHPSREQCPLTAYCDGVTADGAALHDKVHEGGEAGSQAGTLLMSWLMDEASSRH